jgi:hypothetical protein
MACFVCSALAGVVITRANQCQRRWSNLRNVKLFNLQSKLNQQFPNLAQLIIVINQSLNQPSLFTNKSTWQTKK